MTTKSTKEQGKREYLGLWETGANVFLSKTTPSNYFKLFTEALQTQVTDFRSQEVSSKIFTTRKVPLTFSLLAYIKKIYYWPPLPQIQEKNGGVHRSHKESSEPCAASPACCCGSWPHVWPHFSTCHKTCLKTDGIPVPMVGHHSMSVSP